MVVPLALGILIVVAAGQLSSGCKDPLAIIGDTYFRDDVHLLYKVMFDESKEIVHQQYDDILTNFKKTLNPEVIGSDTMKDIEAAISDIEELEYELNRLSEELKGLPDYKEEGGAARFLHEVREKSELVDQNLSSQMQYINRPRLEGMEELSQKYARNQMIIMDNDFTLMSQGIEPEELLQLRNRASEATSESSSAALSPKSDSDSGRQKLNRPLSWRSSVKPRAEEDHSPDSVHLKADGTSEPDSKLQPPLDIWTTWGQWKQSGSSEGFKLRSYPPETGL